MNVNLSPTFEKYIQQQLKSGIYNNASEVIREALRLKMQQDNLYQAKIKAFQTAIIQGENSGETSLFDIQEIIQEAKQETDLDA